MSLSVGNHQIWIETKANWITKTPSEVVVALVIPQWTCRTTRAPVVLTKQKEFVTGKSKREFPTRALSFDKIDLFLRKHNMGWDWKALDSGQQTRASLLEEKFVSSWVLESYSSLRVYRPHWEQGSGTISPKCFEWNPAPLARQILCDRRKYFSVSAKFVSLCGLN